MMIDEENSYNLKKILFKLIFCNRIEELKFKDKKNISNYKIE